MNPPTTSLDASRRIELTPLQPSSGNGRRAKAFVFSTFLVLASVCWLSTRAPGGPINLFERGHWLGPASDMLAGKIPYRETLPVHGFLADGGMDFLLFSLLGPSFLASLDAHHFLGILFQPALFLLAAAATRRPLLAVLSIPLNVGFATAIVADRPVLPLLSLAAFLFAIGDERRRLPAFVAGLLGGIGFLYALDFGTFVLAAEIATLVFLRFSRRGGGASPFRASLYFLGLAAIVFPFAGYLTAVGAFLPYLRTTFIDLPTQIGRVWGWDFPDPIELGRAWISGQPYRVGDLTIGWGIAKRLYLAPILGSAGAGLAIFLHRRYGLLVSAARLLALSVACLLSFRYVIARLHLEAGNALTGPVFIATTFVLYELLRRGRSRQRWPAIAFAGLYFAAAIAMNVPLRTFTLVRSAAQFDSRLSSTVGLTPLNTPRGDGVLVWGADASEVEALVRYFDRETQRDSLLLDLTNRPGLYFFLRRINPTRFYQVPLMGPFQDEVLADLERNPPAAILLQTGTALDAPDGVPNAKRIPRVWEFVTNRYPKREHVGSTLVALPADSAFGPPNEGSRP